MSIYIYIYVSIIYEHPWLFNPPPPTRRSRDLLLIFIIIHTRSHFAFSFAAKTQKDILKKKKSKFDGRNQAH